MFAEKVLTVSTSSRHPAVCLDIVFLGDGLLEGLGHLLGLEFTTELHTEV